MDWIQQELAAYCRGRWILISPADATEAGALASSIFYNRGACRILDVGYTTLDSADREKVYAFVLRPSTAGTGCVSAL